MNKTGFNGYVYDFSADYDAIAVDDIKDVHKYLIKKNNIVQCVSIYKMFVFIKKLLMLIAMSLHFILLVLKQVNVVIVVIILTVHMEKYVFLMLQKI